MICKGKILIIRKIHIITNNPFNEPIKEINITSKKLVEKLPRRTNLSLIIIKQPKKNIKQQERRDIKTA